VISRALLAKVLVRRSRRRFGGGLVELLSLRVDLCEETGTRAMHASVERMEKIGVAAVKGKTKKKKTFAFGSLTSDGGTCLHAPFQMSSSSRMSDVPI
jgi:hypothetical protein